MVILSFVRSSQLNHLINMTTKTLRLVIDVTYEPDGPEPLDLPALRDNLRYIADNAASRGLMSQGTSAMVTEWHASVDEK